MPDELREAQIKASVPEIRTVPDDAKTATIRKAVAENSQQGALETFRTAATATLEKPSGSSAGLAIEGNIGTKIDKDGKKVRSTEETARLNSLQKYEKISRLLAEKGYGSAEFATHRDEARQMVEGMMTAWPELAAVLPADPAARAEFLTKVLEDPKFLEKVKVRYKESFAADKKLTDEVTPATEALAAAKRQEAVLETKIRDANARLNEIATILEGFKDTKPEAIELAKLTKSLAANRDKVDEAQIEIDDLAGDLTAYRTARVRASVSNPDAVDAIDVKIAEIKAAKDQAEKNKRVASRLVERQAALTSLKTSSEAEKTKLEQQREDDKAAKEETTRTRLHAQATLEQVKNERAIAEQDYVDSVTTIIQKATADYLEGGLSATDVERVKEAERLVTESGDKAGQAIGRQILSRYERPRKPTILNPNKKEPSKYIINSDFDTLISLDPTRGPDAVVRAMLDDGLRDEVRAGRLTVAEQQAMLDERMNDKEWLERTRPMVVEGLVAAKIKSGKVTQDEANVIISSDWGIGMIDRAITKNSQLSEAMQKLRDQGVLKEGLVDVLKKNPKLVYILLGIIGGAVALPVGIAAIGAAAGAAKNIL